MADLAEIVRGEGARYLSTHRVTADQRKALLAIAGCQTEALGTIIETCQQCAVEYELFRSCRNRSCPRCQGETRARWLAARIADILPVSYLHAVFNAPRELHQLALYCPELIYDILIRAAGQTVIDVGWSELGVQLGCHAQFQTWMQNLAMHLHTHCAIPCLGVSNVGMWRLFEPEQLPVRALSRRFRALVCRAIRKAAQEGAFKRLPETVLVGQILARIGSRRWKVYAKPPFGGPEQLFAYLARYTNRVAITNDRIERYEDHQVTLRCRDNGNGCSKETLDGQAFVQRFVRHVPPKGFVRSRSYGFLANRNRKSNVRQARASIGETNRSPALKFFQPLRLCPRCYATGRGNHHFQPSQHGELAPAVLPLTVRPPPIEPVAA